MPPARTGVPLLSEQELELTTVVANNTMNRERGLSGVNSYARELGLDPAAWLLDHAGAPPTWLDLCSGTGRALVAAAPLLPPGSVLTGVDLIGPLVPQPLPAGVELVVAPLATWSPPRVQSLVTCVHGLHYLGDKLGLLARAASWLAPNGLLIAHLDPASLRLADGAPGARPILRSLRAAGFDYDPRRHLISLAGGRTVELPFRFLGADPDSGPNYTGQPAVASHYEPIPRQ